MKTNIIIATAAGFAGFKITGTETFDLVGDKAAIKALQEIAPVLKDEGNSTNVAGDVLGRMVYNTVNSQEDPFMEDQDTVEGNTFLRSPLVAFQVAKELDENPDGVMMREWETERIFLDETEATAWLDAQRYRYAVEDDGKTWRLYGVPATGYLASLITAARKIV